MVTWVTGPSCAVTTGPSTARSIRSTWRDSRNTQAVTRQTPALHAASASNRTNALPMPRRCHKSSTRIASSASVPLRV
jgi:hypothetical protein